MNTIPSFNEAERRNVQEISETLKNRCDEFACMVRQKHGRNIQDGNGGPYCGIAGPAFMCYYLSRFSEFSHKKDALLDDALSLIEIALSYGNLPSVSSDR